MPTTSPRHDPSASATTPTAAVSPFTLGAGPSGMVAGSMFRMFSPVLDRVLQFPKLREIYEALHANPDDVRPFLERFIDHWGMKLDLPPQDMERIPTAGPCVVVSNHPFGAIEGVILGYVLRRMRPDVKIMANYMLSMIPDIRDLFFFVDPFGKPESARRNIAAMKESIRHVQGGGMLVVFPAGEVSHLNLSKRAIIDPPWSETVSRIIRRTKAPVLPIYFGGANSKLFQIAGMIHPRLRTLLIPRELFANRRRPVAVRVGSLIPHARLQRYESDQELTEYLRLRTYVLKGRTSSDRREAKAYYDEHDRPATMKPIIDETDPALVASDIGALPTEQVLVEQDEYRVVFARHEQIPNAIREIGRLREITFREVGEGTGNETDLDEFDPHYLHLIVFHTQKREMVGAYRMGLADEIVARFGKQGLYTSTLFRYRMKLLKQLGKAIEMGRSWVRPEYQRSYAPLLLLWKGIGHFLALKRDYVYLFGPVSINNDYQSISRRLIMWFLLTNRHLPELARMIKARNPPPMQRVSGIDLKSTGTVVTDIDEVSSLVSDIETDHKGAPILLKQYLKLGAKLLGFNIDPNFGHVLDGLVLVDCREIEFRVLSRYMGKEACRDYFAYHGRVVD